MGDQKVIGLEGIRNTAMERGASLRETEIAALSVNIIPCRYLANTKFIGAGNQMKLLSSKAVIVGCGALGGYVCDILARLGIGRLTLVDFDVFTETNLNRQSMCTEEAIGKKKAMCAMDRVMKINSSVEVSAVDLMLDESNASDLISGADVVVDAVDNPRSKLILEHACISEGIPMVHGALADSRFQVAVICGGHLLRNIYAAGFETATAGTPACTAAACAGLQAGEVLKLLLYPGDVSDNAMLRYDWQYWNHDVIDVSCD